MSITSGLAAFGDLMNRDAGHALNAGSNLITNGSLHGAGNPLGTALVNSSHNAYDPGVIANLAAQSPAPSAPSLISPINQVTGGGDQTGGTYSAGGGSVYTGGTGSGTGNQADIAAYQDQINQYNQLLQSADATANTGQDAINRNYQSGYNQLQDQNNQAVQNLNQAQNKADSGYQQNIQGINTNSRNSFNSLQRLLAGSGSAAEILAPYLVAQQANQQKSGAATNYADNVQGITTSKKNTADQYQHGLDSLLGQKNDKLSALLSSIDQQKMQYQQQLGAAQNQLNIAKGGNYQTPTASNNAIAALIAQQQGLASQYADPVFQVTNLNTAAPDVSQFQQQAAQLGNGSNQAPSTAQGQDATSSALAALLKQNQDKNNLNTNAYAY